jgi:hypothetical protein
MVIVIFFFAIALVLLFVFFLAWLLAQDEDTGTYPVLKRICVEAFWVEAF